MISVSLSEKGGEAKQLQFDKSEVKIGRVQGNDVVLPKGNVSKRHCVIRIEAGRFLAEDTKSTNGTYINGRKIAEPIQIFQGDKIYIGDFIIRVENAPSSDAASLDHEPGSLRSALSGPRKPTVPPSEPEPSQSPTLDPFSAPPLPPPPPSLPTHSPEAPPPATDILLDDEDDEPLAETPPKPSGALPPPLSPTADELRAKLDNRDLRATQLSHTEAATPQPKPASSSLSGSDWLGQLLADGNVTSVFVMAPDSVQVVKHGVREVVELSAADVSGLETTLANLVKSAGGTPEGVVDVMLAEATRLFGVFPPASDKLCASLSRPASTGGSLTLDGLTETGSLSPEVAALLSASVSHGLNMLVCGDRSATQMLVGALVQAIPPSLRVVAADDRVTASLPGQAWITLRPDMAESASVLLEAVAAARPDLIVADLDRYDLASEVVSACARGQQGVLATVAARSAQDALAQLAARAQDAALRPESATAILQSAIDLVVHAFMQPDGKLTVTSLAEPRAGAGGLEASPVFEWTGDSFAASAKGSRVAQTLTNRGALVPGLEGTADA